MLTDTPSLKQVKSPKAKVSLDTNKRWSDKQKIECVTTFIALGGSVAMTAAVLKIPEQTIFIWKRSEWWHDLVSEIKQEERLVLSNKLKRVMDKSWDVVSDRLENGDFIFDQKKGELVRKPVSLRDASKVANDVVVLREKLERNDNFTVAGDQIDDKLNKLAKAFQDLAKGVVKMEAIEDINFTEHDTPDGDEESNHTLDA